MTTEIQATCGQCIFWREVAQKSVVIGAPAVGACYGVPPTPYPLKIDELGRVLGQVNIRAGTRATEPACGLYVDSDTARAMRQGANN